VILAGERYDAVMYQEIPDQDVYTDNNAWRHAEGESDEGHYLQGIWRSGGS